MNTSRTGPRLNVARWPGPMTGDQWGDRIRINANRIAHGWGEHLAQFSWEQFVTLTFHARREGLNTRLVSRETFRWCGDAARLARRPVGWAYAVEGGGGPRLHAHVLLMGLGAESWRVALRIWEARNGTVDARSVYDAEGVASYVCKAIGPNGEVVLSDTLTRYPRKTCG